MEIRHKLKNFIKEKWGTLCRRSHYVMIGIPFLIVTAGVALTITSVIRIDQVLDGQMFQYAAERYESGKNSYRLLTVLGPGLTQEGGGAPLASRDGLNLESIKTIHETLDLTEQSTASQKKGSKQETETKGETWRDCYSTMAIYPATGYLNKTMTASVEKVEVVGVGGDYAVVHPFLYESGGFLPDEDGSKYCIVLNTQLAWNLFHSYSVLGSFVEISGTQYEVVGVVNEGRDDIAETVGVTKPRAYIKFSQLAYLANGSSVPSNSMELDDSVGNTDLAVTCYEVLLTDPIKNIAKNDLIKTLTDTIGYSEDNTSLQIINNTGRFNVLSLLKKYFPLKNSYVGGENLSVPYYERSARLAEQYVLFWAEMIVVSVFLLILGGCNIYAIFHGKETKHVKVEETEEDNEISYLDERMQ